MSAGTGRVHCPTCGEVVEFEVNVSFINPERDGLWISLYDPKPRHKCKGGKS